MSESKDELIDEVNALLLAYQTGEISDAKLFRLRSILKQDAEARRHFAALQALETALYLENLKGGAAQMPSLAATKSRRLTFFIAATAAMIFLGFAGFALFYNGETITKNNVAGFELQQAKVESHDDSVATLTDTLDAEWEGASPIEKHALPSKTFNLVKGVALFEFHSGSQVSIQGPAKFEFVSAYSMKLQEGGLRACVPAIARGFTVETPSSKVVDLGTEFSVNAAVTSVKISVIHGQVDVFPRASGKEKNSRRISAGAGVEVAASGEMKAMEPNSIAFKSLEQFRQQKAEKSRQRFLDWQNWRNQLRNDSRVLASYDFQRNEDPGYILREGWDDSSPRSGTVIGSAWTAGRWPGKDALEFKAPPDRVRVEISGEFDALTFTAWVRIDSLENRLHGLLLTDSYEVGSPHWQISETGSLRLGVRLPDRDGRLEASGYGTPPIFDSKRLGVWTFLSTVYDRKARSVRHFVDGHMLSEHELAFDQPLHIGIAAIGNWGVPLQVSRNPIRNLLGRMDEMNIFKSPLSDNEIMQLYQSGRP